MKKILTLLLTAFAAVTVHAQDATSGLPVSPEFKTDAVTFLQNVNSNQSITIAAYPMYAPDIVVNGKKDVFGMGVAFLTPASAIPSLEGTFVGDHAFAGLRFDYLAHQAFASTIGVGIRGHVQLWNHDFTGFVHAGANIPMSGFGDKNVQLGGMVGAGIYTDLYHFTPNLVLGLQASTERWTQFNSQVYLGGPLLSWNFGKATTTASTTGQ